MMSLEDLEMHEPGTRSLENGDPGRTSDDAGDASARHRRESGDERDRAEPNLGRLLLVAFELFSDEIISGIRSRGFPDFRLTDTRVVRNLEEEGTRITELAERARMTKQAMSELVRRVERRGYVERRPDPDDGRAKRVHMTETGLRLTQAAREAYRDVAERWAEALGEEEFARLEELLTDLLASQDALPRFEDPLDW